MAVLISLVYLSQQTRQNSKHTRALIHQGRAALAIDIPLTHAENASLAEIRIRGDEGDETLDHVQLYRYFMLRVSVLNNWEDQFYQHRDGLLGDDRFAGTAKLMDAQFHSPGCRYVWHQARSIGFAADFQAFVDDIMHRTRAMIRPDPAVAEWKAFMPVERAKIDR